MTVTLIGMPAVGKSCMGKALSRKLKMRTVDGDRLIEHLTGQRLQEIIDREGMKRFKEIEADTLLSINEDNIIITPGGSAIYYPEVMEHFKEKGIVVYLYASVETIIERLGDFSKRGVVLNPGQTIRDLYNEREPLLKKYADITVNCDGRHFAKYQADAFEQISKYLK